MSQAIPTIPETAAEAKVKERVVEAERLTKLVPDKVHTWPYLVRLEMLVGTLVMAFMTVWSIVVDAPLAALSLLNAYTPGLRTLAGPRPDSLDQGNAA